MSKKQPYNRALFKLSEQYQKIEEERKAKIEAENKEKYRNPVKDLMKKIGYET